MPSATGPDAMRSLARSVLSRNLALKRGQNVIVESWTETLPWANAFVLEAFRLQARPLLVYVDEPTFWESVGQVPTAALGRVGSHEWAALREADAYVFFYGPSDVARENALPMATFKALTAYESEWFRIVEKAGVRSVRIDLGRTNEVEARRHGLDLEAWRSEMVRASLVDPTKLQREGAGITRTLSRGRDLRITHPNGTDLRLRLRGRRPRLHDGLVDAADQESGDVFELLPSGWVIVAIDERFAEGAMVANVASTVAAGGDDVEATEKVVGGRWRFRDGKLVEYGYAEGGDEFARIYRRLGEGKERPGTISIGLNPEIHDLPGMEDQVRGRITLAIGRNAQHGGSTQTPYFHSYLVIDGASLQVDEKTILKDGEIV